LWTDIDLANMMYRNLINEEYHLRKLKKDKTLTLAINNLRRCIDYMDKYIEVLEGDKS